MIEVLVPWRDSGDEHRARAWEWVRARWAALHPDWPIILGTCTGEWSTAAALNDAAAQATADTVVVTGADCALNRRDTLEAVEHAVAGRLVMLASELHRPTRLATDELLGWPVDLTIPRHVDGQRSYTRNGWGPLAAPLELIRGLGWDDRFIGWGGEDEAFYQAATTLGTPTHRLKHGVARLLWHPRQDRHQHAHYVANMALLGRYRKAGRDRGAMVSLLAERHRCDFLDGLGPCTMLRHRNGPHRITRAA